MNESVSASSNKYEYWPVANGQGNENVMWKYSMDSKSLLGISQLYEWFVKQGRVVTHHDEVPVKVRHICVCLNFEMRLYSWRK